MPRYSTTLFESPMLEFVNHEHGIIQPDDFEFANQVDYRELNHYRDEIAELVECYDNAPWPDDRDEFARMTAEYEELKELLKALDFALSEFSRDDYLIHEYDFDDYAYERFLECYEVPDNLETYLDKDKIVRDMSYDFGMTDKIGYPEENKLNFWIV